MGIDFPEFARNRFNEILVQNNYSTAGGTSLTRRAYTRTKDNAGRLSEVTTADTTINGFIQYVTAYDKKLLEQGWALVGDGVLFIEYNTTINIEDGVIDQDSVEWEVIKLVSAPKMQGKLIHKVYNLRRRD